MLNFLADLYQKYPHLYNTGMVCSFYPQVIFQVWILNTSPDINNQTITLVAKLVLDSSHKILTP